jgi:hypothetical protein
VGGAGGCAGENRSIVAKLTDVEAERDCGGSRLFTWRPSATAAQKGNGIGGAARRPLAPLLDETLGASSRLRKRWCPRRSCSALGSGGHGGLAQRGDGGDRARQRWRWNGVRLGGFSFVARFGGDKDVHGRHTTAGAARCRRSGQLARSGLVCVRRGRPGAVSFGQRLGACAGALALEVARWAVAGELGWHY